MKITADFINAKINQIRAAGLEPYTEYSEIKHTFPRIVIGSELSGEGNIRTFEEVEKWRKKYDPKYPKIEYTEKQYQQDLEDLYKQVKDRLTVKGEISYQRESMEKTISTFLPDMDVSSISVFDLKQAFSDAHEAEQEAARNRKRFDSRDFWETVRKNIENVREYYEE